MSKMNSIRAVLSLGAELSISALKAKPKYVHIGADVSILPESHFGFDHELFFYDS